MRIVTFRAVRFTLSLRRGAGITKGGFINGVTSKGFHVGGLAVFVTFGLYASEFRALLSVVNSTT